MKTFRCLPAIVVAALFVHTAACKPKPAEPPQKPKSEAPAAALAAQASHAPATAARSLSGTVQETMNSGGYTYVRLLSPTGETWAAVNESQVKKGDFVTVQEPVLMEKFESKTLNRTFDRIVFGTLAGSGGAAAPGAAAAAPAGSPHGDDDLAQAHAGVAGMGGTAAADPGPIKVEKAPGADGKTVAEVHASRAALKDKQVAVRGKVVKFLPGIMGRNWLHLRDGSGSRETKDDDLTVTTLATAAVGDVVVVKGSVRVDKDFGAGYAYPVIVEDAQLTK